MANDNILVWWLSQRHCEKIGDPYHPTEDDYTEEELEEFKLDPFKFDITTWDVPEYIKSEYVSRLGRAGRGRLWVAEELEEATKDGIKPWPEHKQAAKWIDTYGMGGIVFWKTDLPKLERLPGIITDWELNLIKF